MYKKYVKTKDAQIILFFETHSNPFGIVESTRKVTFSFRLPNIYIRHAEPVTHHMLLSGHFCRLPVKGSTSALWRSLLPGARLYHSEKETPPDLHPVELSKELADYELCTHTHT